MHKNCGNYDHGIVQRAIIPIIPHWFLRVNPGRLAALGDKLGSKKGFLTSWLFLFSQNQNLFLIHKLHVKCRQLSCSVLSECSKQDLFCQESKCVQEMHCGKSFLSFSRWKNYYYWYHHCHHHLYHHLHQHHHWPHYLGKAADKPVLYNRQGQDREQTILFFLCAVHPAKPTTHKHASQQQKRGEYNTHQKSCSIS